MTPKNFLKSFDEWRKQKQELVLASVFETAGSTYSKTGARMLINSNGDFQGMLSGGRECCQAAASKAISQSGRERCLPPGPHRWLPMIWASMMKSYGVSASAVTD
jgi:xanthine/CO dehydrogenase XdhC/CoxF family maturation factor